MIVFGLTGNICTGKSLVASYFSTFRIPVFDADKEVHELYTSNFHIIQLANKYFPDAIVGNIIDRSRLTKYFLKYDACWVHFQKEVHKLVLWKQNKFIDLCQRQRRRFVVLDVPLLISAGFHKRCDYIVLVRSNKYLQHRRIINRCNFNQEKFQFMNTLNRIEDSKLIDFIINTDLSKRYIYEQVIKILKST